MAYAPDRSLNGDLYEGMTDGTYKKVNMNRGGVVENTTARERSYLRDVWHGIHEVNPKMLPDGRLVSTGHYVATVAAEDDI